MEIAWNNTFIDLENVINISKGDRTRVLKYLNQFQELIPPRIQDVKQSLELKDRKMTCKLFHQMSPQLQFFGIPNMKELLTRLELEYKTMTIDEWKSMVQEMIVKIDQANKEVAAIIEENFND